MCIRDSGGTDGHAGGCHARVEPQGKGGQAEDQLIGVPDDAGEYQKDVYNRQG